MLRSTILAALMILASTAGSPADKTYQVELTRRANDLYEMQRPRLLVRTRSCFRFAFAERAILIWNGFGGEVVFVGPGQADKCDVQAILAPADVKPGRYALNVYQAESDWYETSGVFVRTSFCIGLMGDVLIEWNGIGGEMIFRDSGRRCQIEDLWIKARL